MSSIFIGKLYYRRKLYIHVLFCCSCAGVCLCVNLSGHYIPGRHAGGSSLYDITLRGGIVEHRGKHSKLKCHGDINGDRLWPPIAAANWVAGKIQRQPVKNRLIRWKWQDGQNVNSCWEAIFFLYLACATSAVRQNVMFYDQARQKKKKVNGNMHGFCTAGAWVCASAWTGMRQIGGEVVL